MNIQQPNDKPVVAIEAYWQLPADRSDDVSSDGDRWSVRYCALFIVTGSILCWIGIVVIGASFYAAL